MKLRLKIAIEMATVPLRLKLKTLQEQKSELVNVTQPQRGSRIVGLGAGVGWTLAT